MDTSILQSQQNFLVTEIPFIQPQSIQATLNESTLPQLQLLLLQILQMINQYPEQPIEKNVAVLDELEEEKKKCRNQRQEYEKNVFGLEIKIHQQEREKEEMQSLANNLTKQVIQLNSKLLSYEPTILINQSLNKKSVQDMDNSFDKEKHTTLELELLLEKEKNKNLILELKLERQMNMAHILGLQEHNQDLETQLKEKLDVEMQLRNELKVQNEKVNLLQFQIQNITGLTELEFTNKGTQIGQFVTHVEENRLQLSGVENNLQNLSEYCQEQTRIIKNMEFKIHNKTNQIQQLTSELEQGRFNLSTMQHELEISKKQYQNQTHRIENMELEIHNKTNQIEQLTSELERRQFDISTLQQELNVSKMQYEEQNNKINNLELLLSNKTLQVENLTLSLKERKTQFATVIEELIEIQNHCKEMRMKKENCTFQPLNKAVQKSDVAMVKMFLEAGLDVENEDSEGWRPVHNASRNGNLEMVKLLASYGANLTAKQNGNFGDNPLLLATSNGREHVVVWLLSKEIPVDIRNNYGTSPLHAAAWSSKTNIAKLLLERGASVNAQVYNSDNKTPLHLASYKGHVKVSQLLIDHGADLEARTSTYFHTPLHWAAMNGNLGTTELLVNNGANVSATDKNGKTPKELARDKNHLEVVEYLSSL